MKTYTYQVFDTRNTCLEIEEQYATDREAISRARELSKNNHHIIVNNQAGFEEYEKQELTSWSYPKGLGQIEFNS